MANINAKELAHLPRVTARNKASLRFDIVGTSRLDCGSPQTCCVSIVITGFATVPLLAGLDDSLMIDCLLPLYYTVSLIAFSVELEQV